MTLQELIDQLQECADDHGGDVEVRFASQPNYPLEYAIGEVAAVDGDERDPVTSIESQHYIDTGEKPNVTVYICEGRQIGYLPGVAARALGWRD